MQMKSILGDIRFWIFLFFIVRLFHITNPPLEVSHNWRQTTVTMPARNFFEGENNILLPKVDFAGEKTGITGMEFPILNYLIYLVSLVFGYAHWYGRLITLVFSCFGLWYFYKLVHKYFNISIAFKATFILLFSVWFTYSRKIMPDTFSMSLVIAGIYYGSNYFDQKNSLKNLLLYFTLVLAGILSKLPSGYLLVVMIVFLFDKKIPILNKSLFIIISLVIMSFVSVYYFYWVPRITKEHGFDHFFMGKGIVEGMVEIFSNLNKALQKFYNAAVGYTGFILFICALFVAIKRKEKNVLLVFGLCFFAFLVIVFKGGATFYNHTYYIVPFAPVMAFICAYGLSLIKNNKLTVVFLALIAAECILVSNSDFYIKEKNLAILNLEKDLDQFSKPTDLILINSGEVPTPVYFAHRKGWIEKNELIADTAYIESLRKKKLKYIIILKKAFGNEISLQYKQLLSNPDYTIYDIQK
ncbi:MAG: glycosyltransferase family 39 protein [Bacteroidetes bacterium]|nr:glycosyltransferase family 39 protein [Bacteroidota bacterium]